MATRRLQRRDRFRADVEPNDPMLALGEALCHRKPHGAKPDHGNGLVHSAGSVCGVRAVL